MSQPSAFGFREADHGHGGWLTLPSEFTLPNKPGKVAFAVQPGRLPSGNARPIARPVDPVLFRLFHVAAVESTELRPGLVANKLVTTRVTLLTTLKVSKT